MAGTGFGHTVGRLGEDPQFPCSFGQLPVEFGAAQTDPPVAEVIFFRISGWKTMHMKDGSYAMAEIDFLLRQPGEESLSGSYFTWKNKLAAQHESIYGTVQA